ncbi:hypothetical protein EHYA_06919 [Embleya hyalina]|uniref:Uncharacterized protein n=1 Tax=Embleya hyalina TaxID=516124 RepID=A0A401YX75_9ACTN|nr:hypothetical protein EHYA_06919 [Embleya hyalina]
MRSPHYDSSTRTGLRDVRGCPHLDVNDASFLRVFHPGRRTFDYLCEPCAVGGAGVMAEQMGSCSRRSNAGGCR